MITVHRAEYFELVLKPCVHTYGTSPCAAAVGTTGAYKCYNSPATCQDPANFSAGEQVIRWAVPSQDLAIDIDAIPSVSSIAMRAQQISPGESLGTRESLSVSFCNHRHNDVGFDKYLSDRDFNPYNQGTFWGKFAARWPNLQGLECRYVRGFVGQTLDEMERRFYAVESTTGPDNNGGYSITAKDALKFLDNDKAVVPLPSPGLLNADITDTATSLVLSPSGIGDASYPSAGLASMGDEKVSYTRSGDTVTLTGRALSGSKLSDHKKDETFQISAVWSSKKVSEIFYDLLHDYTDTPSEYLDFTAWDFEAVSHIGRLFSGEISKPTGVKKVIDGFVQEIGLSVYTDTLNKKIVMKSLRNLTPVISLTDDYLLQDTLTSKFETQKRISQILFYYAQKNPLEKEDEEKNYFSIYNDFADDSISALEAAPSAIKKIYSRWITVLNRPAAESAVTYLLRRYQRPPRSVGFKLPYFLSLNPGDVFTLQSWRFEDSRGAPNAPIPFQALSVEVAEAGCTVLGEQIPSTDQAVDDGVAIVDIDSSSLNLDLRAIYDTIYLPPESGDVVKFIFRDGINVGSVSASQFAIDVGSWPAGVIIELHGDVRIAGWAGQGYTVVLNYLLGVNGGPALYTRFPIKIYAGVKVWAGGGSGGGKADVGSSHNVALGGSGGGSFGTTVVELGAAGGGYTSTVPGGHGGDVGYEGDDYDSASGGVSGIAIDGVSYVTFVGTVDVRGPQVN